METTTMEDLKASFLRVYANVPLSLRDEIAVVLTDGKGVGRPISWDAAYLEVIHDTKRSQQILANLRNLEII